MTDDYGEYIARKLAMVPPTGLTSPQDLADGLFDHQAALTAWALRRGRAAIFADTGLGKSRMQLAWADRVVAATSGRVLVLAPLAVAAQTVREGAEMGLTVTHCREPEDVRDGINITNYDRLHKFCDHSWSGVVLDESSCIKHHDAKTLRTLLDAFAGTEYKLCATATPAPNDWTELGTHAEFLGVCTRAEMLAEYFVHDGAETQVWRLKGHAREQFWRWVASWAALVRKPSDLGFADDRYNLPSLTVQQHVVASETQAITGMLFALEANTLSERRAARRDSLSRRVDACAAIVNADPQPWLIWCDLNDEQDALEAHFGTSAFSVRGSMDADEKESAILGWISGERPIMVSKPSIMGWGINAQHCARIAFVGVTDSWEAYYQAVRRCWRFGQTREVHVHIFASEMEGAVVANLKRKERDAAAMSEALSAETCDAVRAAVTGSVRSTNNYNAHTSVKAPTWLTSEAI